MALGHFHFHSKENHHETSQKCSRGQGKPPEKGPQARPQGRTEEDCRQGLTPASQRLNPLGRKHKRRQNSEIQWLPILNQCQINRAKALLPHRWAAHRLRAMPHHLLRPAIKALNSQVPAVRLQPTRCRCCWRAGIRQQSRWHLPIRGWRAARKKFRKEFRRCKQRLWRRRSLHRRDSNRRSDERDSERGSERESEKGSEKSSEREGEKESEQSEQNEQIAVIREKRNYADSSRGIKTVRFDR